VNAQNIALYSLAVFSIILLLFALMVLWKIYKDEISLEGLLAEPVPDSVQTGTKKSASVGKASLARFQFMIFTFVIAGLYLLLSVEAGTFVDIPTNVLGLLGISGGSYLVSKGLSGPKKNGDAAGSGDSSSDDKPNPDKKKGS
jgi:hypothetical protein